MQIAPLLHVGRGVTAIIGGGGKTTLMETLAGELSKKGKVIITTTTHIRRPEQYETLLDADEAAVSAALERSGIVCAASQAESGKLCAPWLSMGTLAQLADFVLVEADGAKRLPLKAHASHDPGGGAACHHGHRHRRRRQNHPRDLPPQRALRAARGRG